MHKNMPNEANEDQGWILAKARFDIIYPFVQQRRVSTSDKLNACQRLGLSPARFSKLLADLRERPELAALMPKPSGRKSGRRSLDPLIEDIIDWVIRERYLTRERPSLSRIMLEIGPECEKIGKKRPSRAAVQARIEKLDRREVVGARYGKKAADDQMLPVPGTLHVAEPLHFVQIDHTQVDLIIVDDINRQPLQRPWLTVVIDVATRMIAGYYLSLEAASATSVAMAMRHAVLPKDEWLASMGITGSWPVAGIPSIVHMDNAKEFHSRALTLGALEYGIDLRYRPVKTPRFGGHIERLTGTLMMAIHSLPGTTFSNVGEKGDYDSEGNAIFTLRELDQWLALHIVGVYHNDIHSALGRPPLAVWNERVAKLERPLRMPLDQDQFHLSFLPFQERLIRRDGVRLFGVNYWDDVMSPWAGRTQRKHRVRYDPRNMLHVYLEGPDGAYWAIRFRNLKWPVVTLWEIKNAQRKLRAQGRSEIDEEMLFSAIGMGRAFVERSLSATKAARRIIHRTRAALQSVPGPDALRLLPAPPAVIDAKEPFEDVIQPDEIEEWS